MRAAAIAALTFFLWWAYNADYDSQLGYGDGVLIRMITQLTELLHQSGIQFQFVIEPVERTACRHVAVGVCQCQLTLAVRA